MKTLRGLFIEAVLALILAVATLAGQIPNDVFARYFGPKHPFKLLVHGADFTFTRGGVIFRVPTDGFELSDRYYYNVPVFIDVDEDYGTKGYRLYSTIVEKGEKFSVDVVVVDAH